MSGRVSRAQLAALFPGLSRGAIARAVLQTRINEVRTRVYIRCQHHLGLGPARLLLRPSEELAGMKPPVIFGTFHIGPTHVLGAAMESLPGEVLVLRRRAFEPAQPKNVRVAETVGSDEQRAHAFHRAVMHLRRGGYALLPIDPLEAARVPVPFFGRTLLLARGAFALSRVARVPIVPVVTRWRGARAEVICGPPIEPAASEEALAAHAARWLESYLKDAPGEVTPRVFELLS